MATAASRPSSCLSSLHITSPDPLNSSTAAARPRPPLSPAEPRAEEGWNGEGGRDSTKHHTAGSTGDLALGRARLWIPPARPVLMEDNVHPGFSQRACENPS